MMNRNYRIMTAADPVFGSVGRAVPACLRRLGHEVESVNFRTIIPKVTTTRLKALRRFLLPWFVRDYNRHILSLERRFRPELFLTVKGSYILARTLRELRDRGVRTYNYYPDVSAFTHDKYIPQALPEYDHIFSTKSFHQRDFPERLGIRNVSFLPHGYDPDVYRPFPLSEWDKERYGADVSFIGSLTLKKERLIGAIACALPDVKIKIWGNGWRNHCKTPELRRCIMNQPVEGWAYAKAVRTSKISLAVNSEIVKGASSGDLMSQRSFEIPACGGLMLHERNEEVQSFYEDGEEMLSFETPEELVEKVRYYLEHPDERRTIARAGRERCVPAYSYDQRMKEFIHSHEQMTGQAGSPGDEASRQRHVAA